MPYSIQEKASPIVDAETHGSLAKLRRAVQQLAARNWLTKEKRTPLLYTGSSIILSVAQMISGVVLVQWILPRELGLWQSVSLALPYAYLLLGGINNGLSRELPYYLGSGDEDHAKKLVSTTQLFTAAGSLAALAVGATALAFLSFRHSDVQLSFAVAATTLLIVFNFYRNFLTVTFRSRSSFIALSWTQVLEGALMLATLPLVYYLRYDGMLFRLIVTSGIVAFAMYRIRPIKVRTACDWKSLRLLLRTGIPIFALDYIRNCSGTMGSVALLNFGGLQDVGVFAVAATASAGFEVLPNSVAHYIYPRMTYQYGRDGNARGLWSMCWKTCLILLAVMLPFAFAGWFCLPPVIAIVFPKYVAGIRAAQLMLFGAVAGGLAVCVNALWSLKAWKAMTAYQIASAALLAVGPFAGIRLFVSPLTGVAVGVVAARFLSAAIGLALTYYVTCKPPNGRNTVSL